MACVQLSAHSCRFRSVERLKQRRRIKILFEKGRKRAFLPFDLRYCQHDVSEKCHQVLFAVPKRHFPKAPHRQKLRRRLREAHRRNKHLLQPLADRAVFLLIAYVYAAHVRCSYATIEKQVKRAMKWLVKDTLEHATATKKS